MKTTLLIAIIVLTTLCGCNALAENPTASARCTTVGPGWGATDIACTHCCTNNGAIGRHSASDRCICIGTK